ncbi:MAG: hypothetical protein U0636_05790 [Phycisphaerales bacterium]
MAQAWVSARAWLEQGSVPAQAADPEGLRAAAVVLRFNGRPVGEGKAIEAADGNLRTAMAAAMQEARRDPGVKSLGAAETLPRLTLELEIGSAPVPLVGSSFEDALSALQPAMQGLALRYGDAWGYMPVSHALERSMAAPLSRTVLALLAELHAPPKDLAELRASAPTTLYQVPAIRMVQLRSTSAPMLVTRLAPSLVPGGAGDASIAQTAQRIAGHLVRGRGPMPPDAPGAADLQRLGLPGNYDPLADEYRQVAAPAADQALAAYALARIAGGTLLSPAQRTAAQSAACTLLKQLADVDPSEHNPAEDVAASALALLAAQELKAAGTTCQWPANAAAAIQARVKAALEPAAAVRPSERAMALAAAAALATAGTEVVPAQALELALTKAWSSVDGNSALTVLPWLLLAERAQHHATEQPILQATLGALIGTQLVLGQDASAPPDEWGAYPLAGARTARATAQSARAMHVVALLAQLLPPDDVQRLTMAQASLRAGARFLQQLQAGTPTAYAMRSPERADGAIMAAPFDPLIQPAAQAMALLALQEAQEVLAKPARPEKSAPAAAQPAPAP